jgi:hypothetical protein
MNRPADNGALMAAALVKSDDGAVAGAPHHHRFFGDHLPLQLLRRKLSRQPGHVPGVPNEYIGGHGAGPFFANRRFDDDFPIATRVKRFLAGVYALTQEIKP